MLERLRRNFINHRLKFSGIAPRDRFDQVDIYLHRPDTLAQFSNDLLLIAQREFAASYDRQPEPVALFLDYLQFINIQVGENVIGPKYLPSVRGGDHVAGATFNRWQQ